MGRPKQNPVGTAPSTPAQAPVISPPAGKDSLEQMSRGELVNMVLDSQKQTAALTNMMAVMMEKFDKAVGNYEAVQEKQKRLIDLRTPSDKVFDTEEFKSLADKQMWLRRNAFQLYLVNMSPYFETKVDHHAQAVLTAPEIMLYHEVFDDDAYRAKKKTKVFDPATVPGILRLENKFDTRTRKELWEYMRRHYEIDSNNIFTNAFNKLYATDDKLPYSIDPAHYLARGMALIRRAQREKTVELQTPQGTIIQQVIWMEETVDSASLN